MFDALYQRMKLLRKCFEAKFVTINAIGVERRKYKIDKIRSCLSVYDILLGLVENMDCEIEIWVITSRNPAFKDILDYWDVFECEISRFLIKD